LTVVSRTQVSRELPVAIHLGVALPKGDRQTWLVEKAVELGVAALTPLKTKRGVAQPFERTLTRLRRSVIEASKQCGRTRLMQINEPQLLADYLRLASGPVRWLAHPGGQAAAEAVKLRRHPAPESWLAIGPEGGFADDEVQAALAAGWQAIDLGPRLLRVETAAVYLAALVAIMPSEGSGKEI
jgi:16S rRNA (uracil1498-N3)-methyltransferase